MGYGEGQIFALRDMGSWVLLLYLQRWEAWYAPWICMRNNTEALYCTPLNFSYGYHWSWLGFCWANPPWSHILKMLTKAVLDRAKVDVIIADLGQPG